MDASKSAREILEAVGGTGNVRDVTNCFTRLRFELKDESKADKEKVSHIEGVIQVTEAMGQVQVVMGAKVSKVFEATHGSKCLPAAGALAVGDEVAMYLCPRRRVTFDGFVSYEGRRLGVPYWYDGGVCRVSREGECLHVYSEDLARELCVHPVTWGRKDSFCEDQHVDAQPCEVPSQPVRATVPRVELPAGNPALAKFDLGGMIEDGR